MKRWWLIVVLLLSLGVNLGLLASRVWQRSPGSPGMGGAPSPAGPSPRFALRLARELDLQGEQREAFLDRQRLFLEQTLDARDRFGRLQAELRQAVTAEDPDRRRVDELLGEVSEARVDLERAFVDNLLDTRELLAPEQERRFLHLLQRLRGSRDRDRLEREGRPWLREWRERRDADRDRRWRRPPGSEPESERPETDPDAPLGQK